MRTTDRADEVAVEAQVRSGFSSRSVLVYDTK